MYSDRNFEIRQEFVDPNDAPLRARVRDPEIDGIFLPLIEAFFRVMLWTGVAVVIAIIVLFALMFLGWVHSFTLTSQLQPPTQSSQHEHIQQERRSPVATSGEEASGNAPAPGRTQQYRNPPAGAEAAPQNQVVRPVENEGAAEGVAPVFHWVCVRGSMLCEVQDSAGNSIQKFWLENRSINSSSIHSSYGRLPPSWGCAVSGQKLDCDFADGQGHIIQRFLYDGQDVEEVRGADTKPLDDGNEGYAR